jgi:surface polysaccharide O-acyltransferase-like enzyme
MGVIAMPLFFITNGYLLFGKTNKDKYYTYKKRDNILILVFLWNMLYTVAYIILKHEPLNPFSNTINNLFFQSGSFGQFWFFGSLIIIYIMFPSIDRLYFENKKHFLILAMILVFIQIIMDGLNIFTSLNFSVILQSKIPQTFRLESHLSYFILGGIIKQYEKRLVKYIKMPYIIILYIIVVIYQWFMVNNIYPNLHCEFFYDNIFVICLSSSLFIFINNKKYKDGKNIAMMANLIMLIFILHPFIIHIYDRYINTNINAIKLIFVFSISAIISLIIVKIPYTKRLYKI